MGRLKSLSPRLRSAPLSSVGMAERREGVAPALSATGGKAAEPAHKAWYKTRRWKALRLTVLTRDHFTCQRTGAVLGGKHPAPDSPVVNHKVPHRGREDLFWDPANLETVSKEVHDRDIQREEQASLHHRGCWD